MSPKVTIAGYFGAGNTGDEAILAGMVASLRQLGIERITALSWNPAATSSVHGISSLPIGRRLSGLCGLFHHLRGEDLFILGGGGLLQDRSRRVVPFWISRVALALAAGTPVMYYGLGVGPLRTPLGRLLVGGVSNRAKSITVRDDASKSLLRSLGVTRPPIEVTADSALCMDLSVPDPQDPVRTLDSSAMVPVAVCLRSWEGVDGLLPVLASGLASLARQRGVTYRVIPLHPQEDFKIAAELHDLLCRTSGVQISQLTEPGSTPGDVATQLAATGGVITMRLHAAVLGALAGVPSLGLAYDTKVRSFFEQIASTEHCLSLPELRDGPERFTAQLVRWFDGRALQQYRMLPAVRALRDRATRNTAAVRRLVL